MFIHYKILKGRYSLTPYSTEFRSQKINTMFQFRPDPFIIASLFFILHGIIFIVSNGIVMFVITWLLHCLDDDDSDPQLMFSFVVMVSDSWDYCPQNNFLSLRKSQITDILLEMSAVMLNLIGHSYFLFLGYKQSVHAH